MSEVFNSSVLDAINRAVQDGISTTALEVDGTPQYCIINAETREIEIPGELNIFGVESDEKSTRVYFRCPKYVGTNVDLDMTKCMVYVPYRNANGEKDQYIVTDLNETEDGENVEFTWLISRKASAYMGITEFGIRAIKTAVGGTIEAEWNTTVASANVIRGMDVGLLEFSEENKDALAQALDLVKQEIELKGQETIATIPDDYTTAAQNALSAKTEVEDIREGYDGKMYDSAGDAVRGQIEQTLRAVAFSGTIINTSYERKLSKVLEPVMFHALEAKWDDLPPGKTSGIVVNIQGNDTPTFLQLFLEFNTENADIYERVINDTTVGNWYCYGAQYFNNAILYDGKRDGTSRLLENILWPTMFHADVSQWDDLPIVNGNKIGGVLLNIKGNATPSFLQLLYPINTDYNNIFTRAVSTKKEENGNWIPLNNGSTNKYGKICGCLGDSITYGLKGTSWTTLIGKICGFSQVINYGISGDTIEEMNVRVSDMEPDLDYIIVWGGVNNFMWTSYDINTFKSNYETLILNIVNKYPSAKLLAITPMKFKYTATDVTPKSKSWNEANPDNNLVLKDYVEAEIEVLEKYSIPYLNFFINSGMSPEITSQADVYFSGNGDYLHPNTNGNLNILAPKIGAAINLL